MSQGYLVREYKSRPVECYCGKGNKHFHASGDYTVLTPLA